MGRCLAGGCLPYPPITARKRRLSLISDARVISSEQLVCISDTQLGFPMSYHADYIMYESSRCRAMTMMVVDFEPIATAAGTLRLAASASLATATQTRGLRGGGPGSGP